jgi:hypothetical protein
MYMYCQIPPPTDRVNLICTQLHEGHKKGRTTLNFHKIFLIDATAKTMHARMLQLHTSTQQTWALILTALDVLH